MSRESDLELPKLKMLERKAYVTLPETDPLIFYYLPFFGPLYRRRAELALSQCVGGQRVLEIGYGSGVVFPNLAERYTEIHGIDLFADADQVMAMWRSHHIDPSLKQGDLLSLPYPNGFFDTVLLISILEHIKSNQLPKAMVELHRVLKPGGQLVYGVPIERPLLVLAYRLLGYNIREHHFSTHDDVAVNAHEHFSQAFLGEIKSPIPFVGAIYQVGQFLKGNESPG